METYEEPYDESFETSNKRDHGGEWVGTSLRMASIFNHLVSGGILYTISMKIFFVDNLSVVDV